LIEVTDDPDSDRRDVVRVLSSDTGVVIDVLRLANSAMYGDTAEIASLLHPDIVSGKIFAVVADAISESFRASPVGPAANPVTRAGRLSCVPCAPSTRKDQPMITVGMNYNIREGKEQEFESVFTKVLEIMGKMDGHGQTHLYRDVAEPASYLIVSEWSSQPAFEAFISSKQFKNVTDWGKADILTSRPKHEIYGAEPTPATPATGCPMHDNSLQAP